MYEICHCDVFINRFLDILATDKENAIYSRRAVYKKNTKLLKYSLYKGNCEGQLHNSH